MPGGHESYQCDLAVLSQSMFRCGDLFCAGCLKYRRKLNQLAHFDPQGRPYKVSSALTSLGRPPLNLESK